MNRLYEMKNILNKILNAGAIVVMAPLLIIAALIAPRFMSEFMSGIDETQLLDH